MQFLIRQQTVRQINLSREISLSPLLISFILFVLPLDIHFTFPSHLLLYSISSIRVSQRFLDLSKLLSEKLWPVTKQWTGETDSQRRLKEIHYNLGFLQCLTFTKMGNCEATCCWFIPGIRVCCLQLPKTCRQILKPHVVYINIPGTMFDLHYVDKHFTLWMTEKKRILKLPDTDTVQRDLK